MNSYWESLWHSCFEIGIWNWGYREVLRSSFATLIVVFYNWSINCFKFPELVPDTCKVYLSFTQTKKNVWKNTNNFKKILSLLGNKNMYKISSLKIVKHSATKDLITKGKSSVSLFFIFTIKMETCLVTHHIKCVSRECFLALYAIPCGRQACSDLANLLHFHWLDIFSPFPKLAIKASFAAVLVKLRLPLYHFWKPGIYLICGIVKFCFWEHKKYIKY